MATDIFTDLQWWQLCIIAVMVFIGFLFTNYIIKKINEARMDERLARSARREATTYGTQYHELGLNSEPAKETVPAVEYKPPINKPKRQISLTFEKNEINQQDHRAAQAITVTKTNNAEKGLENVEDDINKKTGTLSCNLDMKQENNIPVDNTTAVGQVEIKNTSYQTLANILLPISEILQKPETTDSNTIESLGSSSTLKKSDESENGKSSKSDINMDITKSIPNMQTIIKTDKRYEGNDSKNFIENNSMVMQTTTVLETNKSSTHEHSDISSQNGEPDNEASTEYLVQSPKMSQKPSTLVISKEILLPEKDVALRNTQFLISDTPTLPAAAEIRSQITSNSSLIKTFSSVKATNTPETTVAEDSKKDGNHPSTTVGLVMLDVTQKVGYSLFHNTNDFITESEQEVTNIPIDSPISKEKPIRHSNPFSLSNSNFDIMCSNTKNLARDVTKITLADSDPQTSKTKKKKGRKKITHKFGNKSKLKYTRNLKSFWDILLSHRRS